jgi:hypothetical protein
MPLNSGICRLCIFLAATAPLAGRAQAPATWRLEPIATIEGVSDADPFSQIRNIALHADGRLVVVDEKVRQVSMFDARGKSLGVVGRIGGGPGEYRDPYSATWLADTLAIYDPREARVVFFVNGTVPLRTQLTQHVSGGNQIRFYPVSRAKSYLWQTKRVGAELTTVFIGFGGEGSDTVTVPKQPEQPTGTICNVANGGITFFTWPESPRSIAFPVRSDGALAIGNTGEYRIAIQSRGTVVATMARKDLVPLALDDFMWEQENAGYRKHVSEFGAASCKATPVRPPYRAPIRALTVADNGEVWISVRAKDEFAYNVFSADGRFLATVKAPIRGVLSIPIAIAGDRLAYVEDDRDGVQVVRTFRILK